MNEFEGRKKNLQEELRHFRAHAGAIQNLEFMAQSGDTLKYMRQMKAIKDRIKAGTSFAMKVLVCVRGNRRKNHSLEDRSRKFFESDKNS